MPGAVAPVAVIAVAPARAGAAAAAKASGSAVKGHAPFSLDQAQQPTPTGEDQTQPATTALPRAPESPGAAPKAPETGGKADGDTAATQPAQQQAQQADGQNVWSWLLSLLNQPTPAAVPPGTVAAEPAATGDTATTAPRTATNAKVTAAAVTTATAMAKELPAAADTDSANTAAADGSASPSTATLPQSTANTADDKPATPAPPAADTDKATSRPSSTDASTQAPSAIATPDATAAPALTLPVFARSLAEAAGATLASTPASHSALPANQAEWPELLNDQVRWQLGHNVQEARLDLHPRDLGSVQVQLRLSDKSIDVQFAASQPQAREALAAALPQLRAMLAEGGMQLAQAQVGSQSQSQSFQQPRKPLFNQGSTAAADEEPATATQRVVRVGLVDDFA
jgi:flagellar hook-length control protein FliK